MFAQFSSDGQHLVTRSSDDTAQLWDISLSKPLLKLPETYQYDDQQAKDSTALDQDSVQDAWQDKETLIRSIQFSPNGAYLLVNSAADTARLLTLDGEIVSDFSNLTSISGIEFTHNGQYILTRLLNSAPAPGISGYPVRLWDSEGAQFTKFNDLPVNGISVSADEQAIVTVSEGREIILQVEKEEKQLEGPQSKDQPLSNRHYRK